MELTHSLNALLRNEGDLRRTIVLVADGAPPCYKHATVFSHIVLCDGLACFSFFYCCYVAASWKSNSFVYIHLSVCIYVVQDLSLEWTFGFCCVVMLVAVQQLSSINALLLKASNERTVAFEQIVVHFCNVYGRISIDVRKGLSVYYGPLVCAVKMVDIWGAVSDGTGELTVLGLSCLWLLIDVKKFVILMLVSEHLNRKVSIWQVCFCCLMI
uniref:Gustatory receptor n=1 Tax=Anopheles maculatus TaxID=74869 RepID=A0A182STE3_9DIPT